MKALRWHGRGDVRVDDVPVPVPAPHEVLLKVERCGICGSDLEEYRSGPIMIPVAWPHPHRGGAAPIALGHEAVGRVVSAAADGSGPAVGALVVPDVVIGCGRCYWCQRHEEGLCGGLSVRGQTEDGGLAQYMVAKAASCLVVPDHVTADEAALVEPASVAVRAMRKVDSLVGASVAVVGAGTVGQLVVRVATAAGASVDLAIDPSEAKRARTLQSGAAHATHPDEALDVAARQPREGFDVVFECSGARGTLDFSTRLARRGGTVVALGIHPEGESVDAVQLVLGEKRIVGSAAHLWDEDSAVALGLIASGRLEVADLISHRVSLAETVESGFGLLASGQDDVMKVLVDCG